MGNHTQNTISRRHFLKQMGVGLGLLFIPTVGISSAFAIPNPMLTQTKVCTGIFVPIKASDVSQDRLRESLVHGFPEIDYSTCLTFGSGMSHFLVGTVEKPENSVDQKVASEEKVAEEKVVNVEEKQES